MTIRDEATGIFIVPERDDQLTPLAKKLLTDHYLRASETPQQGYARACKAWSGGDDALAQRLYDGVSRNWFMFASPVLSNAPLLGESVRGMPISCFLTYVPDSLEGLMDHSTETRWLSVLGGGVGGHWRSVRSVSKKAPGPIPFLHTVNADMDAYSQGTTRRGSYAAYLDVSHPDVMEFIGLRKVGGDENRKCFSKGFHHGLNVTDAFMDAVCADALWDLVDPHDRVVRQTVKARELWQEILETRYRTGEPYIYFIDAARRAMPQAQRELGLELHGSNLCIEITLPTNEDRTAVCCLSSLNAETFDEWKGTNLVKDMITMLDNVLDYFIEHAPSYLSKAAFSAKQERALGLGLLGFHSYLQKHMVAFDSAEAITINGDMFQYIKEQALQRTYELGLERGEAPDMIGTGRRNSHLLAIAPNANSALLAGASPSIEPEPANAFVHESRAGTWPIMNKYLKAILAERGYDTDEVWSDITTNKGSVQHLDFLTEEEKRVFKTAIEINQMWVVRHAADRQRYICQSQSLNLFFPPRSDKDEFHDVHMKAWKSGLKSLYYCRSASLNRADNVSKQIKREALKDSTYQEQEADCVSCQG